MKLIVDGTAYDITESLQGAAIGDLMKLKVKTKTPEFLGVTVKFIQDTFFALGDRMQNEDDFDPIELLGDEAFLNSAVGLIWLARRKAGEQLEISDAEATPFNKFSIEPDVDELEEAVGDDPKALGEADGNDEAIPTSI